MQHTFKRWHFMDASRKPFIDDTRLSIARAPYLCTNKDNVLEGEA